MKVKASLHLHSQEDLADSSMIDYSLYELIDRAHDLGFKVLGSTGHYRHISRPEHIKYASQKGILLITGVELSLDGGRHLVILNGGESAEKITSFSQINIFKKHHHEALIIAPHPNHGMKSSMNLARLKQLGKSIDAVEHSWFYLSWFNPNIKAEQVSQALGLPVIATSDAHTLDYIGTDYAVIDTEQLSVSAVFRAIRSGKFTNVTRHKSVFELVCFTLLMIYRKTIAPIKPK